MCIGCLCTGKYEYGAAAFQHGAIQSLACTNLGLAAGEHSDRTAYERRKRVLEYASMGHAARSCVRVDKERQENKCTGIVGLKIKVGSRGDTEPFLRTRSQNLMTHTSSMQNAEEARSSLKSTEYSYFFCGEPAAHLRCQHPPPPEKKLDKELCVAAVITRLQSGQQAPFAKLRSAGQQTIISIYISLGGCVLIDAAVPPTSGKMRDHRACPPGVVVIAHLFPIFTHERYIMGQSRSIAATRRKH